MRPVSGDTLVFLLAFHLDCATFLPLEHTIPEIPSPLPLPLCAHRFPPDILPLPPTQRALSLPQRVSNPSYPPQPPAWGHGHRLPLTGDAGRLQLGLCGRHPTPHLLVESACEPRVACLLFPGDKTH